MFSSRVCTHIRSPLYHASESDVRVGQNMEVTMLTQLVHNTNYRRITVIVLSGILTHILSVAYFYQK